MSLHDEKREAARRIREFLELFEENGHNTEIVYGVNMKMLTTTDLHTMVDDVPVPRPPEEQINCQGFSYSIRDKIHIGMRASTVFRTFIMLDRRSFPIDPPTKELEYIRYTKEEMIQFVLDEETGRFCSRCWRNAYSLHAAATIRKKIGL